MQELAKTIPNQIPTRELKVILGEIANSGLKIPPTAQTVYQDLILGENSLRLYAVSWAFLSPENTPEWMLMLVLCRRPSKSELRMVLPEGIKLRVSDKTGISVQKTLNRNSCDSCLYILMGGSSKESFVANITLANGMTLTLPPFSFRDINE